MCESKFKLSAPLSGDDLLEKEYLEMRSHLLEVAAAFDRIERAGGSDDERLMKLQQVARIAVDDCPNRAERFLNELSE